MKLFRIVQNKIRTKDLSGTGAFQRGGRWNSKGTYMLYTSENSSLAYLENIIPFDKGEMPPQLYIMEIAIPDDAAIFTLPDARYNKHWMKLSLLENQEQGDGWMNDKKYLGIRVRSAVNPDEYNCLLNPLYPGYHNLVKVMAVREIAVDYRLVQLLNK